MTSRRYANYQRALRSIAALDHSELGTEAIDVLRQSAEDLLLSRDSSTEPAELAEQAATALAYMRAAHGITQEQADHILGAICACGPPRVETIEEAPDVLSQA